MVTIPQTELGFGCGGWSAWRGTIFVAFGDQLHHSFWMSKQRHPLCTVCTEVPCPRDHRGAMACINVPRTVSKMWWTFNDLPSHAGSSWHLLKEGIPSTSKTITQIHRSLCPSFVHTLSMYISLSTWYSMPKCRLLNAKILHKVLLPFYLFLSRHSGLNYCLPPVVSWAPY